MRGAYDQSRLPIGGRRITRASGRFAGWSDQIQSPPPPGGRPCPRYGPQTPGTGVPASPGEASARGMLQAFGRLGGARSYRSRARPHLDLRRRLSDGGSRRHMPNLGPLAREDEPPGLDQLPGQSGSHPLPDRRGGRARRGLRGRSPSAVVRYRELEALRDQDRVDRHELRTLRRTLSCRSTRIRSLLAVLLASEEHDFAQTALRAIEAVRRGKDLDMARMAVAQADAAVGRLEALLDHQVWGSSGVTEESGAPDRNGAQLLPTQLKKFKLENLL